MIITKTIKAKAIMLKAHEISPATEFIMPSTPSRQLRQYQEYDRHIELQRAGVISLQTTMQNMGLSLEEARRAMGAMGAIGRHDEST